MLLVSVCASGLKCLGARGVRVVRDRFLGISAVVIHLGQDGNIHTHLQEPADPELHGRLSEQEVARLKGVSARPHQHHFDAKRQKYRTVKWKYYKDDSRWERI